MHRFEQIPLVGPGSELQLTLDGRAVPHAEVISAREGTATPDADRQPASVADAGVPDGQTTL
jgi:hypothetical protein